MGCLMSINTPQNWDNQSLLHHATITCTNTMQYIRGKICPEVLFSGSWYRQTDVCKTKRRWFSSGLVVERVVPCARNYSYRTWGEVRVHFVNRRASDSGWGGSQACVG